MIGSPPAVVHRGLIFALAAQQSIIPDCGNDRPKLRYPNCESLLFGGRRFLQWRWLPTAVLFALRRPCLNQLMRNVGPFMVLMASTSVLLPGRVEFPPPSKLQLGALRRGEHTGAPQGAALAVITWVLEIPGVKLPPRHGPATVRPPQPHDLDAVLLPRRLQLLSTAEEAAVRGIGTKP